MYSTMNCSAINSWMQICLINLPNKLHYWTFHFSSHIHALALMFTLSLNTVYLVQQEPSWSYGNWSYNFLYNQRLSPIPLWVWIPLMASCTHTTSCVSPNCGRSLVFSNNKNYLRDIAEKWLKVAYNTISIALGQQPFNYRKTLKIALILLDYIFHYNCLSYEEIKHYIFTRMKQHYYCLIWIH